MDLVVGDGGGSETNLIRGRTQALGRQMSQTTDRTRADVVGNCSSCRAQGNRKGRHKSKREWAARKLVNKFGTGHLPVSGEFFRQVYPIFFENMELHKVDGNIGYTHSKALRLVSIC
jgi:hypothetical protein